MTWEGIVLNAEEAAEALGSTVDTIRRYCRDGVWPETVVWYMPNKSRKKGYRIRAKALLEHFEGLGYEEEVISLENWLKIHKSDDLKGGNTGQPLAG